MPHLAYYNEIDPRGAASLRELIRRGIIAPGDVDERSIEDVRPSDLAGYVQCHFFAGAGVWSYALRCAGWPDDRPVWTGSCPCQPFSAAGKEAGVADERHLWPAWDWLIDQRRPRVIFGEQVESAILHGWLDLVQSDLEGKGYAFGPVGLPAAGFGAPHIRQRLYFVADAGEAGRAGAREDISRREDGDASSRDVVGGRGEVILVADASNGDGRSGERGAEAGAREDGERRRGSSGDGFAGDVGHAVEPGLEGLARHGRGRNESGWIGANPPRPTSTPGAVNGFWGGAEWIPCRDGKRRPVEPGTFPLAHGAAGSMGRGRDPGTPINANNTAEARTMRLHLYGNSIVAPVAEAFIRAYLEVRR